MAAAARPFIVPVTFSASSARILGLSKWVVARTMALARETASARSSGLFSTSRGVARSRMKMPEPTKMASAPSCIMRAASAGVAMPPAAEAAASAAGQLRKLGFVPDIIIGHHGWGELLNLTDVYPGVPILGYFEFFYRTENADVNFDPEFPLPAELFRRRAGKKLRQSAGSGAGAARASADALAVEHLPAMGAREAASAGGRGGSRAICQAGFRDTAPQNPEARTASAVSPRQKLLTYVARNLEPYRGFHTFMRALPNILDARRQMLSSPSWAAMRSATARRIPKEHGGKSCWRNCGGRLDLPRACISLARSAYEQHLALLKRSDAHVYLSYPFVASWSLREALGLRLRRDRRRHAHHNVSSSTDEGERPADGHSSIPPGAWRIRCCGCLDDAKAGNTRLRAGAHEPTQSVIWICGIIFYVTGF